MRIKQVKMFSDSEWDNLVKETYGRPYCFQQQNGCIDRGCYDLEVPGEIYSDFPETVPEILNGEEMGVKFSAWLARDPKQPLEMDDKEKQEMAQWRIDLWWERNFYPDVQEVANDLHAKGLLPAGEYKIDVDW